MFVVVTNQYSRARQELPNADLIINTTEGIRGVHIAPTDELRLHGDESAGYPDGLLEEYQRLVQEKRKGSGFNDGVHNDLTCGCCRKEFVSIFDNTHYCSDCERLFNHGYCTDCSEVFGSVDHSTLHNSIHHGDRDVYAATTESSSSIPPEPEPESVELPTVEQTEEAIESIESQPQTAEQATYERMLEQEIGTDSSSSSSGLILP